MPRVSPDHLAARKQQIADAALRCFAAQGFHATSMQDIFRESGLSAGAVYRYFPSKTDLVREIASQAVQGVIAELEDTAAADPTMPMADLIASALTARLTEGGVLSDIRTIIIQLWAEALRDAEIREFFQSTYSRIGDMLATLVERDVAAGRLPEHTDPKGAARLLMAVIMGYVVQMGVLADVDADHMVHSVRATIAGIATDPPQWGPVSDA